MFVLIETADVDILSVKLFSSKDDADTAFECCVRENLSIEHSLLTGECSGTLRLAGDVSYAVQLIEGMVYT